LAKGNDLVKVVGLDVSNKERLNELVQGHDIVVR